jgi:hypothetical protein
MDKKTPPAGEVAGGVSRERIQIVGAVLFNHKSCGCQTEWKGLIK